MANLLQVETRTAVGRQNNRRLRAAGKLPAVLYGHGEETVSLSLSSEELETAVRHGAKVVDLKGAASGKALLQEVQWDTFFHHVLHVDLLRVVAGEKVTVSVEIELKGEAPGTRSGGVLEHVLHSVEIEVPLDLVPEKLNVNINSLEIGGDLAVKDIADLPAGATVLADADAVVVRCEAPVVQEEEVAEEAASAEPEVISKGKEEGEGEGEATAE